MKRDFQLCRAPGGYGPYYNAGNGATFTREGHELHIFTYEGYNAMGLIGTELNGIGMVSITDKQVVFDNYLCRGMGLTYEQEKLVERNRILNMSDDELKEFFDQMGRSGKRQLRYNPLTAKSKEEAKKRLERKLDKGMARLKRGVKSPYENSEFMTADQKAKVARDWELFIVRRLMMTPEERHVFKLGADFPAFTKALYDHMHLHMSYIAHFNRGGFFDAQFVDTQQFYRNVLRVSLDQDGMGCVRLEGDRDYGDLHTMMRKVAKRYLPEVKQMLDREHHEEHEQEIEKAKDQLELAGFSVTRKVY